jgi:outer membrane protein assembly factor BamB
VVFTVDGAIGLRRDNGDLLWRIPLKTGFGRHVMTPVVWGDRVVVGSHEVGLIGIKVSRDDGTVTAREVWTNKKASPNFSHPVNRDRFLYGLGPNKQLQCVDLADGSLKWSQSGLIITSANKAYSGFIKTGENILQLTDAGELMLFKANSDNYEEINRTQVIGMNWCNPALADGILYARDGMKEKSTLYAIKVK